MLYLIMNKGRLAAFVYSWGSGRVLRRVRSHGTLLWWQRDGGIWNKKECGKSAVVWWYGSRMVIFKTNLEKYRSIPKRCKALHRTISTGWFYITGTVQAAKGAKRKDSPGNGEVEKAVISTMWQKKMETSLKLTGRCLQS